MILDSGATTTHRSVCLVACVFVLCGDILINVTFLRRSWAPPVKTAAEERGNVFMLFRSTFRKGYRVVRNQRVKERVIEQMNDS